MITISIKWTLGSIPVDVLRHIIEFIVGTHFENPMERRQLLLCNSSFHSATTMMPCLFIACPRSSPAILKRANGLILTQLDEGRLHEFLEVTTTNTTNTTTTLTTNRSAHDSDEQPQSGSANDGWNRHRSNSSGSGSSRNQIIPPHDRNHQRGGGGGAIGDGGGREEDRLHISTWATRLRHLDIQTNANTPEIRRVLRECHNLEELRLNNIHAEFPEDVPIGRLSHLTQLEVSECRRANDAGLSAILSAAPSLRSLIYSNLFVSALSLCHFDCRHVDTLVELEVNSIYATVPEIIDLCCNLPHLEKLSVGHLRGFPKTMQGALPRLKVLEIANCLEIQNRSLSMILSHCPALQRLILRECSRISSLQTFSNQHLRSLEIVLTRITTLKSPHLRRLSVSRLPQDPISFCANVSLPAIEDLIIMNSKAQTQYISELFLSPFSSSFRTPKFPALKFLRLQCMINLNTLAICSTTLRVIEVSSCSSLSSITLNCPALEQLIAEECSNLKQQHINIDQCPALKILKLA